MSLKNSALAAEVRSPLPTKGPQGLKPAFLADLAARLKPCPPNLWSSLFLHCSSALRVAAVVGIELWDPGLVCPLLSASHRLHDLQMKLRLDWATGDGDQHVTVALNVLHTR